MGKQILSPKVQEGRIGSPASVFEFEFMTLELIAGESCAAELTVVDGDKKRVKSGLTHHWPGHQLNTFGGILVRSLPTEDHWQETCKKKSVDEDTESTSY